MTENTENETSDQLLEINRIFPDDLQTHFISNVAAQHQPDHFILTFYEIWPPLIIGKNQEETKQLAMALKSVNAKCVARFVVTPGKMQEIIETLSENLRKYEERFGVALSTKE